MKLKQKTLEIGKIIWKLQTISQILKTTFPEWRHVCIILFSCDVTSFSSLVFDFLSSHYLDSYATHSMGDLLKSAPTLCNWLLAGLRETNKCNELESRANFLTSFPQFLRLPLQSSNKLIICRLCYANSFLY